MDVGHAGVQGRHSLHGHVGMGDCPCRYAHVCAGARVVLPPLSRPMQFLLFSHGTRVKISSPGLGGRAIPGGDPDPHRLPGRSSNVLVKRWQCVEPFLARVLGTGSSCSVIYCIYQLP